MRITITNPENKTRIKCTCEEPSDGYRFEVAFKNFLRCQRCDALVQITPTLFREVYHDDVGIISAMEREE